MKASDQNYKTSVDTTQFGDMNDWDNINVFDDISTQIKSQQKSVKNRSKTQKNNKNRKDSISDISPTIYKITNKNLNKQSEEVFNSEKLDMDLKEVDNKE